VGSSFKSRLDVLLLINRLHGVGREQVMTRVTGFVWGFARLRLLNLAIDYGIRHEGRLKKIRPGSCSTSSTGARVSQIISVGQESMSYNKLRVLST
jgi:hypothetical protein